MIALSDEQLAAAIRRNKIDILVDLAMHTAGNRLLAFARKPAPVQTTYLAYCGKTGLRTIDYRLTDPYLDPPTVAAHSVCRPLLKNQRLGKEAQGSAISIISLRRFLRPQLSALRPLPSAPSPARGGRHTECACYFDDVQATNVRAADPPAGDLLVLPAAGPHSAAGTLPAAGGQVTFGCLNNFCKATPPALALWSGLLRAMPQSRLLLHAHPGSHRDRLRQLFAAEGVAPDRLTFVGMAAREDYFRTYEQMNVALDPFP